MSVTIDHLRVEHRVTVLRDFTDLSGIQLHARESGILRGLGMDYARMEIWIELERNAVRDRLRFALRAADGPRNGHMREYFEMGESVEQVVVKATAPRHEEPQQPASSVPSVSGQQPPHDTSIDERRVACDCDPIFHRSLFSTFNEYSVHACLRCGTVTCTRSIGDDGRFTGDAWQVNRTVALSARALDWLAQLPRIKPDYAPARTRWPMAAALVRYPTLYYPADTRCDTRGALDDLESSLVQQQSGQSVAECLRATCRITGAPPPELSSALRGYDDLWAALRLRPNADVNELFALAQPGMLGSALATDLLLRRADAYDVMIRALRSDDRTISDAGFSMARDMRPVDPRLADVLVDMLAELSCEPSITVPGRVVSHAKFEMIFLLAADANISTPQLLASFRTIVRKVARHDASLVDYGRIAIRELDPPRPTN